MKEFSKEENDLKWKIWWSMLEQGFIVSITAKNGRLYDCWIENGRFRMKCKGGQLKLKL